MKLLYLLRHAKSSWDEGDAPDFDRPLSERGREACVALRGALKKLGAAPERILCSAARRTRETLERIAPVLPDPHTATIERSLYLASGAKLLERVRKLEDAWGSALLIGHNPGLQTLATNLAGSGPELMRLEEKFPTAALVELHFPGTHWREFGPGTCALASFWTPRD
jgi:phosphohistidine phosphatase